MAIVCGLLVLIVAVIAPSVHGVVYTVGDTNGWSQSTDLATWASGKTFTVGDSLLFVYTTMHTLDVVSKGDYDQCNIGNALQTFNDGQTSVPLTEAGPMYFICPTSGHCPSGMKLAINVVAPTTPATSPPAATTPSGNTSPPADLSPPSGSSSGGSTDTTNTSPPTSDKGGNDGHFRHLNRVMVGFSLVMAGLVSFMG